MRTHHATHHATQRNATQRNATQHDATRRTMPHHAMQVVDVLTQRLLQAEPHLLEPKVVETDERHSPPKVESIVLQRNQLETAALSVATMRGATARLKLLLWQFPSPAAAPPQGAPSGSGKLSTPRARAGRRDLSHHLSYWSCPPSN